MALGLSFRSVCAACRHALLFSAAGAAGGGGPGGQRVVGGGVRGGGGGGAGAARGQGAVARWGPALRACKFATATWLDAAYGWVTESVTMSCCAANWLRQNANVRSSRTTMLVGLRAVLPHVLDGASPALVGPLNPRSLGELPAPPSAAKAVALAASHAVARGAAAPPGAPTANGHASPAPAAADAGPTLPSATVSTVAVGFSDGRLLAYAMAGPWLPAWCDVGPQYLPAGAAGGVASGTAAGGGSAPAAVRYTCVLGTGGEAGAGAAAAAASAAAAVTPRMALLDVVELPAAGDGVGVRAVWWLLGDDAAMERAAAAVAGGGRRGATGGAAGPPSYVRARGGRGHRVGGGRGAWGAHRGELRACQPATRGRAAAADRVR